MTSRTKLVSLFKLITFCKNVFASCIVDILLDDVTDGALHKEGHSVKIIVTISKGYGRSKVGSFS